MFSTDQNKLKSLKITNDNDAIEEWAFEKGGTCSTCVTPFGM